MYRGSYSASMIWQTGLTTYNAQDSEDDPSLAHAASIVAYVWLCHLYLLRSPQKCNVVNEDLHISQDG